MVGGERQVCKRVVSRGHENTCNILNLKPTSHRIYGNKDRDR